MVTIEVYEPAMCCSTGVCGPDVPAELVTFSADVDWLRTQGIDVERRNLATEPEAFTAQPVVLGLLRLSGSDALPAVLVDGVLAVAGRYPARDDLARWAGVTAAARPALGLLPLADGGPCCAEGTTC